MRPLVLLAQVLIIAGVVAAFTGITSSNQICLCPAYPAICPCAGETSTLWTFSLGYYVGVATAFFGVALFWASVLGLKFTKRVLTGKTHITHQNR